MPTPPRTSGANDPPSIEEGDLRDLLLAAAKGDEDAWRSIVSLYARRVYGLARSRLGGGGGHRGSHTPGGPGRGDIWGRGSDVAEEVTQSVFVTVAGKLSTGEYTERGRFEAWLFRVAMNRIRDEARRAKRQAVPTDPEALDQGSMAPARGDAAHSAEDVARLREAMSQLGDADREVVELRHHAGLSFRQISEMLAEPLGTLLARHHRALKKLKDILSGPTPAAVQSTGDES